MQNAENDILERANPQSLMAIPSETRATNRATLPQAIDFGWRLHGKQVGVLPDSSLTLLPASQRGAAALLAQYYADGNSLMSCLQCGACTVNCGLAGADGQFPRRQMTLLQLGETDKLVADPRIWFCFNCGDCTSHCPANVGPGRIMAAIRRLAVEQYSMPRWWSRLANQRQGFVGMLMAGIALLLVTIAVGGSFSPQISPVRYASMLPHVTLNLFFGALSALVMVTAVMGTARAWKAYTGEVVWKTNASRLMNSLASVIREVATHRQFSACRQFPLSRWAHVCVFYGFATLMALAGVAATLIAFGASYPLPASSPFKIAGNIAAVFIIGGTSYFWAQRRRAGNEKDASWFDRVLLLQLLLVSITGVLAEIFRYANVAVLAYPTYFLHLAFVFVLLAGCANSKLAHVFYRTVALTAEQYIAIPDASVAGLDARRVAA